MPQQFGPSIHIAIAKTLAFSHAYSKQQINDALTDACKDEGILNLHNKTKDVCNRVVSSAVQILIENYGVRLK